MNWFKNNKKDTPAVKEETNYGSVVKTEESKTYFDLFQLSEEKGKELSDKCDEIIQKNDADIRQLVKDFASQAKTPNELAWCMFNAGRYVEHSSIIDSNPIEELMKMMFQHE